MNQSKTRIALLALCVIVPVMVMAVATIAEPPASTQPAGSQPAGDAEERVAEDPEEEARREYARVVQEAEGKMRRNLHIAGRVVDGKGAPLDGVTVHVEKRDDMSGLSRKRNIEKHSIGQKFTIDIESCPFATVEFTKQGYYRKTFELGWIGGRFVDTLGQEDVVLEKKGTLVALHDVRCILEVEFDGHAVVLGDEIFSKPHVKKPTVRLAADADQTAAVLRIASPRGPNAFLFREVSPEGSQVVLRVPTKVELVLKDGGFIRYQPREMRYVHREMKQAPEDGYEPTLTLEGEYEKAMPGMDPSSAGIFFYFRHGTFYGKGAVTWAEVDRAGRKVIMGIRLLIQPDGTRNLETGE